MPGAGAAKPEMTSYGNFGNNGSLDLPGIGTGAAKPEATAYGKFGSLAGIPAATGAPVDSGLGAAASSPMRAASSQSPTRTVGKKASGAAAVQNAQQAQKDLIEQHVQPFMWLNFQPANARATETSVSASERDPNSAREDKDGNVFNM